VTKFLAFSSKHKALALQPEALTLALSSKALLLASFSLELKVWAFLLDFHNMVIFFNGNLGDARNIGTSLILS